jgi:hypothetical protein
MPLQTQCVTNKILAYLRGARCEVLMRILLRDMENPSPSENRFWDVVVVRQDGQWLGLRAPLKSLRRFGTYLGFLFIACALAGTGWLLSRWQVRRLEKSVALERLKTSALEARLNDLRKDGVQTEAPAIGVDSPAGRVSVLPSLGDEELESADVEITDYSALYDGRTREWSAKFEINRKQRAGSGERYFWIALLHGARGLLAFPSAIGSRSGDSLQYQRGQALEDVRTRRSVLARFKVDGFVESAGADPLYATVLVYDSKGSLLLRKRSALGMVRSQ